LNNFSLEFDLMLQYVRNRPLYTGIAMKFRTLCLVALPVLLAGCVDLPPQYKDSPEGYTLNTEAANVRVVEFIPTQDREKYDEVEMVSCALGGNSMSVESNVESCYSHFKNMAFKLGSNLVWVKPETRRVGIDSINNPMVGYGGAQQACTNCVDMKGFVLKPKAGATVKK
jgi:hypothetical protein